MRTIVCSLDIFTDNSGRLVILPSLQELNDEDTRLKRLAAEADEMLLSEDEEKRDEGRKQAEYCERLFVTNARMRKSADELRDHSQRSTYSLQIPTFGQYTEAEGAAKRIEDGQVILDRDAMFNSLFVRSIEGLKPAEVMALDPPVAFLLRSKLREALYPDTQQIFFLSPAATPSLTAAK